VENNPNFVSLPLKLSNKMKKPKSYAPYIFAFIFTLISSSSRNLFYLPGYIWRAAIYFMILVGMWNYIQWLLSQFENKWWRWIYVLIGINIYNVIWIGLDYYVMHAITAYVPITELLIPQFAVASVPLIIIESINWTKAREKAQIENLRLQAENIEAKFQLLKEQVNPEFLYYCLASLQKMVKSNDPQTEGYILKLADVYRQILKKDRNIVTLKEDLAILKTYLFLMTYGRETSIQYEISVAETSAHYKLPVFALQSLADNCLKHNDFSSENPLYMLIFQKDAQSITMSNNHQQTAASFDKKTEQLEMRYAHEGIENGVSVEIETSTYSTTLKLF
jgi:sensor histidine kinase YesM